MPNVFISYRRADSASIAGRIDDQLVARFGRARIFKDVDSIPPGVNFETYIEDAIHGSAAVLVIIGPRWLNARAGAFRSRRLDDPSDFVRIEIETALRLGVTIIPLLAEHASMPPAARLPASLRPLASLNALAVRPDPDFHRDMERVASNLEQLMAAPRPAPPVSPVSPTPAPPTPEPATPIRALDQTAAAPDVERKRRPPLPRIMPAAGWRSRRGPLFAAVAALALIAVAATAAFSPSLVGLLARPAATLDPTVAAARTAVRAYNATSTAQATASVPAQETQTAQLSRINNVFAPSGVGTCDANPIDSLPSVGSFWSQDTSHGQIKCPQPGITELTVVSSVSFRGLPTSSGDSVGLGFPSAFTVSMRCNFNGDTQYAGLSVAVYDQSPEGNPPIMLLHTNGQWEALWANQRQFGSATGFATYTITITVTATAVQFSFNTPYGTTKAGPAIPLHPGISAITITLDSGDPNTLLDITDFSMTPAP